MFITGLYILSRKHDALQRAIDGNCMRAASGEPETQSSARADKCAAEKVVDDPVDRCRSQSPTTGKCPSN